jgi:hypothetical protein
MKNQIDELFKQKLEHHPLPVPTEAWVKIEATLPKKNKLIIWWRLAAVFLLSGLLVSAIYWLQANEKENAQSTLVEKKVEPLSQQVEKKVAEVVIHKIEAKVQQKPKIKNSKVEKPKVEVAVAEVIEESKIEVIEQVILPTVKEAIAITTNIERPIVLEFTLSPIESTTVARAEEKSTGFKRMLEKAKDFKNGESTFDLQEFKENLFALNTKKDKVKNNQQ